MRVSGGQRLKVILAVLGVAVPFCATSAAVPAGAAGAGAEVHELSPRQSQDVSIHLEAHQAADITVEQLTGRVILDWRDPAGRQAPFRFTQDGAHGRIRATLLAARPGTWSISIAPRDAQPVEYRLRLGQARPARARDAVRAAAQDALARAERLRVALRAQAGDKVAPADAAHIRGETGTAAADEKLYAQALRGWRTLGDACGIRAAFNGLAHLQSALGQYTAARDSAQSALRAPCPDLPSRAHSLLVLQSVQIWLGNLDGTIDAGRRALAAYRATGDIDHQGMVLANSSGAYFEEGLTSRAVHAVRQALALSRSAGDRRAVIFEDETLGEMLQDKGEYQLALAEFHRTLRDLRTAPSPMTTGLVDVSLGSIYARLGERQEALAAFGRALAIHGMGDSSIRVNALVDEGAYLLTLRDYPAAEGVFRQALSACARKQMAGKRPGALWGLGAAEVGEGHARTGRARLLQARQLALALHEARVEMRADISLGNSDLSGADLPDAGKAYAAALAIARKTAQAPERAVAWASLARLRQASGDLTGAAADARRALAIIEDQRRRLDDPDVRTGFFDSTRSYYDLYIGVLMGLARQTHGQRYARAALAAAENERARALTDLLYERAIDIRGAVPRPLLRRRDAAQDALDAAAYRLASLSNAATPAQRAAARQAIQAAEARFDEAEGAIRAANRRYADLTQPPPITVAEIQKQLLGRHTVLLEYWLSEPDSYLWEVTRRHVRSFRLPGAARLDAQASRLRRLLASWPRLPPGKSLQAAVGYDRERSAAIRRLCAGLGAALLGPVAGRLGNRTVALVADGPLRGIPFGLLAAGGGATPAAPHAMTYLPSAGTLRWLRRGRGAPAAGRGIAVFADPVFERTDPRLPAAAGAAAGAEPAAAAGPGLTAALRAGDAHRLPRLPWSRREAQAIGRDFPADERWLALGFAASRQAVLQASWKPYGIVHFATHAIIDPASPELSGIVLSLYDRQGRPVDGFLRVADIYNLAMPARLVVLSACDSAADSAAPADDLYSLANAFFYAGTPRVLASLWTIDDQAAAAFMAHFYRALLVRHLSPPQALRSAQRAMSADRRWRAPYYWSGFVLEGDWR
jgi:CHAT domain-containing protein/tetratricopeptide (TPR) repeat protein